MFKKKSNPHLVEIETENKQLRLEIKTVKHENAELKEEIDKLKQPLDESAKSYRPRPQPEAVAESRPNTNSELQKMLTRKQLSVSDVQERLTILEQVNAATQTRELMQEGLASDSDYEQLQLDTSQEHVYATLHLKGHTGNCFE